MTHASQSLSANRRETSYFLAAPDTQILDVAGPVPTSCERQSCTPRRAPGRNGRTPSCSRARRSTVRITNCGLTLDGGVSFRQLRGPIDTLLVAGGSGVEQSARRRVLRWFVRSRFESVASDPVCTGAFLLGAAGLLMGNARSHILEVGGGLGGAIHAHDRRPGSDFHSRRKHLYDSGRDGRHGSGPGTRRSRSRLAIGATTSGARDGARSPSGRRPIPVQRGRWHSRPPTASRSPTSGRWVLDNLHRELPVPTLAAQAGMSPLGILARVS